MAFRCCLSTVFLTVWSLSIRLLHGALVTDVPPCLQQVASNCFTNAINSIRPSGCNWYLIIPILQNCVANAITGCTADQQQPWFTMIAELNTTLNAPSCTASCPDPQTSIASMQQCYVTYSYPDIINGVIDSPSTANPLCPLLDEAVRCLTAATYGCPALNDLTYQNLQLLNASAAIQICNTTTFSGPTTNAPLPILQSTTLPPSTTTLVTGPFFIGDGTNNPMAVSWIVLISLGGVFLFAVVIAVVCLTKQIKRNKNEHRRLLDENKEEKPKLLSGWRFVSSKYITSQRTENVGQGPASSAGLPVSRSRSNYPIFGRNFI